MVLEWLSLPLVLVTLGLVLMVLEALAPGANFIVVGVALLAAGLVGLLLSPILSGGLLFGVIAGLVVGFGAIALYVYREFEFYTGTDSGRTSDSDALRGKTGRVVERVTDTDGRVKLDEGGFSPVYQARAINGEIPEGEQVLVVDPGGGNVLTVESMGSVEQDAIDRALAQEEQHRDVERED